MLLAARGRHARGHSYRSWPPSKKKKENSFLSAIATFFTATAMLLLLSPFNGVQMKFRFKFIIWKKKTQSTPVTAALSYNSISQLRPWTSLRVEGISPHQKTDFTQMFFTPADQTQAHNVVISHFPQICCLTPFFHQINSTRGVNWHHKSIYL